MYRRYHRRRKTAKQPPLLLAVFLLLCVFLVSSPVLVHQTYLLIPLVLTLCFVAISAGAVFLWYEARKKLKKARALHLADIDRMTGVEFEHYVSTLLKAQGYSVHLTSTTGDYGVDLLAAKNHRKYAIQVKRYSETVGSHAIREAAAGMQHYHCDKAIVITSNYFTPNARTLAASTKTTLIDRDKLADWILSFQNPKNKELTLD